MSYILDALNKSEQERRGQQTPDLQTVHRAPPPRSESKFPVFAAVGVLAAINIAGLAYWLLSEDQATPQTPPSALVQPPSAQTVPVQTPRTEAPVTIPAETISTGETKTPALTVAEPANTSNTEQGTLITPDTIFSQPETKTESRVRITELPINVQRQIPDLVFSSHLFSDEPSFRMVNINGKMRREGDMVDSDLRLVEISEEGVVLGYRHYVFEVSVLRDWTFN
jgi:general secretion pathway protein B